MSVKYIIEGNNILSGEINISGGKNAILPILSATLLINEPVRLLNCPDLKDVHTTLKILSSLGCKISFFEDTITIDPSGADNHIVPLKEASECRSSLTFLGALLGRFGEAVIPLPGGCVLGSRPVNIHIEGMKGLNISEIRVADGTIRAKGYPKGGYISLPYPSVGATENIILAAATAPGTTYICGCATEPEIVDLADFINSCGGDITGAGTELICIKGSNGLLHTCGEYSIIPDRIEAGTFLLAGALTGKNLTINNCIPGHLEKVLDLISASGVKTEIGDKHITIQKGRTEGRLIAPEQIITYPYPALPTDLQAPLSIFAALCRGQTIIRDTVFPERTSHLEGLKALGGIAEKTHDHYITKGVDSFKGAEVTSYDLRCGAALILAGLCAEGQTVITDEHHIERGYAFPEKKIKKCGGTITVLRS